MSARRFQRAMNRAGGRRITHAVTARQRERTAALVARTSCTGITRRIRATDPATGKLAFVWGLTGFTPFELDNDTWRMT